MDQTQLIVVVAAAVVVAALLLGLVFARRRRAPQEPARRLASAQLGPSWSPPPPEGDVPDRLDDEGRRQRVAAVVERSGLGHGTVDTVITAWDEYLAVLGLVTLPADHVYRVFDPYVPPVAERGPDGRPVPDPIRVARDIARRTTVSQTDATAALDAYFELADDVPGGAAAS